MTIREALSADMSLTETLRACRLSHSKTCAAGFGYRHDVTDDDSGDVVFSGAAHEVWTWLQGAAWHEKRGGEAMALIERAAASIAERHCEHGVALGDDDSGCPECDSGDDS